MMADKRCAYPPWIIIFVRWSYNEVVLESVLDNVHIVKLMSYSLLTNLNAIRAVGPDEVPPVLIKRLKHRLCKPLCIMFSQLVSVVIVPEAWHDAYIVPVFKKSIVGDISNYRPISLTCVLSKVMERIIARKIFDYLQLNNILNKSQHGFIRRRSTCTNMLECVND